MPAIFELLGVAYGRDHRRRRNWPHAINCLYLLAQHRILHECSDPLIGAHNTFFQDTHLLQQLDQDGLKGARHIALTLSQHRGHCPLESCGRLCNDHATFSQQASNLVDQGGTLMHQQFAHAMNGSHVLLLNRLDRHKTHRRSAGSFNDGRRIVGVILVGLDEGADILRADQPDFDTQLLETPAPVMGRTTSFHGYDPWRQLAHCGEQFCTHHLRAILGKATTIRAVQLKYPLGQINSENVDIHDRPPHVNWMKR